MKLLFATDGAKRSLAAIEMLKHFSLGSDDSVMIVTVIDMAVPMGIDIYGGYLPDTTQLEKSARENADRILTETAEILRSYFTGTDLSITTEVLFGSPERRIVEKAEETNPDLVVVGSHNHSRWERLLIGSVSNSVVHHAPCSVLVVRTPAQ
jgi:nucleotide-binding universal stress UspA family protein